MGNPHMVEQVNIFFASIISSLFDSQSKTLARPLMGKQADHDNSENDMAGIRAQRARKLQVRATTKMSGMIHMISTC